MEGLFFEIDLSLFYGTNVRGLRTLGPFGWFEGDLLAFGEGLESVSLDGRKVHEQIVPVLLLNKAVALLIGEPFDCSFRQDFLLPPFPWEERSNLVLQERFKHCKPFESAG
jgi:hypothetical protein